MNITDMSLEEALEVARYCKEELYPPTNPLVLLRAGYTLYTKGDIGKLETKENLSKVIDWLSVIVNSDYTNEKGKMDNTKE